MKLVLLLSLYFLTFGQSLKFGVIGNYNAPVVVSEQKRAFGAEEELLSLAHYIHGSYAYDFFGELRIQIHTNDFLEGSIILGYNYRYSPSHQFTDNHDDLSDDFDELTGENDPFNSPVDHSETLSVTFNSYKIGYGVHVNNNYFGFATLGFSNVSYSKTSVIKINEETTLYNLTLGLDIENLAETDLGMRFAFDFNMGTSDIGSNNVKDAYVSLGIGLFYNLDFFSDEE